MNRSSGINHIEFWVSDLSKSMNFYNRFLSIIGWKQISEVSFSNGSMIIYLMEQKNTSKENSFGIRHICFNAVQKKLVDEVYDALHSDGAKIIRGPMIMPYSKDYYTVDFYDPDGQILEVAHTPHANFYI